MATTLILVRHGETTWNSEGRVQGWLDPPLNEAGVRQAKLLAARLRSETVAAIYTSDLKRARATADQIGQVLNLPVLSDERLREHYLGAIQGLTVEEIRAKFPERTANWIDSSLRMAVPDEEPIATLAERMRLCCDELIARHRDQTIVIVSHGGALNVLLMNWLGIDLQRRAMFHISNTSLSRVSIDDGMMHVHYLNDRQHLDGLRSAAASDAQI